MSTSRTIASGGRSSTCWSAWSPLPAASTSYPSCRRARPTASRTARSSSTTRMCMVRWWRFNLKGG